jgi:glycosyltransferase involved in cell wall biosynthesis
MKVALYCPIKPPHHPIPTGDRTIARNLMAAMEQAGHEVVLASDFIAYMKRPDVALLNLRKAAALAEASVTIARLADAPPDVWLTYHPYDKAPDWIGPIVTQHFGIPYITAEATRTGQVGFEAHRLEAQAGIRAANLHMVLKDSDRSYLTDLLGSDESLRPLPPFIDPLTPAPRPNNPTTALLAVGQMRPGKKLRNFEILAEALAPLTDHDWHLTLIGGGPAEEHVRKAFAPLSDQIIFTGAVPREAVLDEMRKADLFVWPGWREPIGMVYLEAQSLGMPVAAFADMGVPLVVADGETGLLALADDMTALTANIARLLDEPALRLSLGGAGPAHVARNHSLAAAGERLTAAFREVLGAHGTRG